MTSGMDGSVQAYYEGGSGDEVTLRENEAAWRAIRFRPHVLRAAAAPSTGIDLLGARLQSPILVAPTALHALAHPEGEVATARGAADAGSLLVLSSRSSSTLEQVGSAATAPWWFQVYAMRDRRLTIALAESAADAGAAALVLTGDTPVVGLKKRATAVDAAALHLRNLREQTGRDLSAADVEQDPTVDLRFIAELQRASGLPVLVKGVLRADDAVDCLTAGTAGLIVSNHGGRQLDRAVATAVALPDVVAAVQGAGPVLVDGGIRTGSDVLAALALGAQAVLLGRPVLRALAADGARGVAELLTALRSELTHAMTLVGASTVTEVVDDLLLRDARR